MRELHRKARLDFIYRHKSPDYSPTHTNLKSPYLNQMDKDPDPTHVEICIHCKRICQTKQGPKLYLKACKSAQNINNSERVEDDTPALSLPTDSLNGSVTNAIETQVNGFASFKNQFNEFMF